MFKRIFVFLLSTILAVGPAVAELPKYSNPTGCVSGEYYTHGGVYSQDACIVRPSFDLPLQTTLVPRWASGSGTPTYTRATTAYQIDFEGKHNLLPAGAARIQGARVVDNFLRMATVSGAMNSENLTAAAWTATTAVISDATTIIVGAGTNRVLSQWSSTPGINILPSHTYVVRFKAKGTAGKKINIYLYDSATGAKGAGLQVTLTASYQVYSFLATIGTTVEAYTFCFDTRSFMGVPAADNNHTFNLTEMAAVDVTGVTNQTAPEYVSVGVLSAPYHGLGADGIKAFDTLNGNTVASNVVIEATGARIDSSQAACAGGVAAGVVDASGPLGYLAEGARADVLGATAAIRRTMSDVGWVNGGTVTVGAATGVDGVASAGARLTFGAAQATNTLLYTTVLGAAVRTYSAWVKRITGTGAIEMTKDGGATWTDITASLSTVIHKQVQVTTASAANPVVGFRGAVNLDVIDVDFNTLEAATFANPTPIPVNVNKAADVLTYPSAGNISNSAGSSYAELVWNNVGSNTRVIANNAASSTAAMVIASAGDPRFYDGTNFTASTATDLTAGVLSKVATAWSGVTGITANNSSVGAATTFSGNMSLGATLAIGTDDGTNSLFGTIRNVRVYPKALSPTKLQQKTSFLYIPFLDNFQYMWAANDEQYRIVASAH